METPYISLLYPYTHRFRYLTHYMYIYISIYTYIMYSTFYCTGVCRPATSENVGVLQHCANTTCSQSGVSPIRATFLGGPYSKDYN